MNRVYFPHFDPNTNKKSHWIELGFIMIVSGFILLTIIYWIFAIAFPHSPNHFGSLLPHNAPLLLVVFVGLHPCYLILITYMNICVVYLTLFLYCFIVIPFITFELRVGRNKPYNSVKTLRRPPMLISAFRTVQVLQQRINQLIGYIFIPTQAVIGKIIVFSTFTIVKNGDSMLLSSKALVIGWSFAMGFCWSIILLAGGYLNLYGKRVLLSWKYHEWGSKREKLIMTKFRKSCKPIDLRYGNTYVMRRLNVLKFIRQLTRGIFRLFLMTGEKL
ncbi:unnamed protein product [Orchesella dallaii]|uniref:Uncharacterized protein n=1 Tax=Orchesella dallaii TaxID=48710 RepID=A0ABP1RGU8_9HEXA